MRSNLNLTYILICLAGAMFSCLPLAFGREQGWPEISARPALPQSVAAQGLNEEVVVNGQRARIWHYRTNLSDIEVQELYAQQLVSQGWQYQGRHLGGIAYFLRNGFYLHIVPEAFLQALYQHMREQDLALLNVHLQAEDNSEQPGTDVYICISEDPLYVCRNLHPHTRLAGDVPGDDPEAIQRYPESRRRLSIARVAAAGGLAIYETKDGLEQIINFYQSSLRYNGWQLKQKENLNQVFSNLATEGLRLIFERGGESLIVSVMPSNFSSRLISIYY